MNSKRWPRRTSVVAIVLLLGALVFTFPEFITPSHHRNRPVIATKDLAIIARPIHSVISRDPELLEKSHRLQLKVAMRNVLRNAGGRVSDLPVNCKHKGALVFIVTHCLTSSMKSWAPVDMSYLDNDMPIIVICRERKGEFFMGPICLVDGRADVFTERVLINTSNNAPEVTISCNVRNSWDFAGGEAFSIRGFRL